MFEQETIDLAKHRIEQSENCIRAAVLSEKDGLYKDAANRSYYSIFHAIRAVLALERFDSKKHSGIISAFRQRYIKTGKFDACFSDVISNAFDVRNSSDYEDFYILTKTDVDTQISNATDFLDAVKSYIIEEIQ